MNPPQEAIRKAAEFLRAGKLVAFPTETVYGLGANALSDDAVASIYEAKGRPSFNPLIVHVSSLAQAQEYALFSPQALTLAKHFWPGPLTLVLPRKSGCRLSLLASAGLDSVAMRMPAHPVAQALLREAGIPLAAPSANRSGRISPTEAAHVMQELDGRIAMLLDGGACPIGIESTVVDTTSNLPVVLRPGSVTHEQLIELLGTIGAEPTAAIKSPGMLEKHYAPSKKLRLNATVLQPGEALLAFGVPIAGASVMENLSHSSDLREAAARLFSLLRILDASSAQAIAVMPIPKEGLGIAINDRLKRAASS